MLTVAILYLSPPNQIYFMATPIPPPLNNTTIRYPWQMHFSCPRRPTYITLCGKTYPQYIRVEDKAIGMSVWEGQKVALRAGRQGFTGNLTDNQLITKPQGPTRTVLNLQDYRYYNQFDVSAFQIVRGSKFSCTPFPAGRTASHARIAEGTFPLADLTLLQEQ